jgi:hypothetical protein
LRSRLQALRCGVAQEATWTDHLNALKMPNMGTAGRETDAPDPPTKAVL